MGNPSEFKDVRELTKEQREIIQFLSDGYGSVELTEDGYVLIDYTKGGHKEYITKHAGQVKLKFKLHDALVSYLASGYVPGAITDATEQQLTEALNKAKEDLAGQRKIELIDGGWRGPSFETIKIDGDKYGPIPAILDCYIDVLNLGLNPLENNEEIDQ